MKLFYIKHQFTDDATYHITLDYLVRAPDEETLYLHISEKVEELGSSPIFLLASNSTNESKIAPHWLCI